MGFPGANGECSRFFRFGSLDFLARFFRRRAVALPTNFSSSCGEMQHLKEMFVEIPHSKVLPVCECHVCNKLVGSEVFEHLYRGLLFLRSFTVFVAQRCGDGRPEEPRRRLPAAAFDLPETTAGAVLSAIFSFWGFWSFLSSRSRHEDDNPPPLLDFTAAYDGNDGSNDGYFFGSNYGISWC